MRHRKLRLASRSLARGSRPGGWRLATMLAPSVIAARALRGSTVRPRHDG